MLHPSKECLTNLDDVCQKIEGVQESQKVAEDVMIVGWRQFANQPFDENSHLHGVENVADRYRPHQDVIQIVLQVFRVDVWIGEVLDSHLVSCLCHSSSIVPTRGDGASLKLKCRLGKTVVHELDVALHRRVCVQAEQ